MTRASSTARRTDGESEAAAGCACCAITKAGKGENVSRNANPIDEYFFIYKTPFLRAGYVCIHPILSPCCLDKRSFRLFVLWIIVTVFIQIMNLQSIDLNLLLAFEALRDELMFFEHAGSSI
jgi:hypothetical protein